MPRSQTHQPVECLSYHGVKNRTLDYGCSREGFCGLKSRTLGLFTPCHSISKPIVILRGKKSQGKVSRGKESQGKVSRGKKSLHLFDSIPYIRCKLNIINIMTKKYHGTFQILLGVPPLSFL